MNIKMHTFSGLFQN